VTTFVALVAPDVYAAALRQPPPADPDATVRVISEGARALGLPTLCVPWRPDTEVDAIRADLTAAGGDDGRLAAVDETARWLCATPGHPPVVGVVSGPMALAAAAAVDDDLREAVDAAADIAAQRVRALAEAGVDRLVVVDRTGPGTPSDLARDAHAPLVRLAAHFGIPVTLIALYDVLAAGDMGYPAWASPNGGSKGARLLTRDELADLDRVAAVTDAAGDGVVFTEWLSADVEPDVVRRAAAVVAVGGRARAGGAG
jgi:hypothetical protein